MSMQQRLNEVEGLLERRQRINPAESTAFLNFMQKAEAGLLPLGDASGRYVIER